MRRNGILLHISSLPSNYGIGTLGQAAYDFVDYLKDSGQSVWQILPVNPTGFGDSPYSAYSTFAANPYFIDLDYLARDGLLYHDEFRYLDWGSNPEEVDYGKLYNNRFPVLRTAAWRFLQNPDAEYEIFKKENADWLDEYAVFMALKNKHQGKAWYDWDEPYRTYDAKKIPQWTQELGEEAENWKVWQYLFYKQYRHLHEYAKKKGIKIIGDIPFYTALDSADVWAHPDLFAISEDMKPTAVAGCPPDNPKNKEDLGQIWGNPLYNWPAHKKEKYAWWIKRLKHLNELYDILRIDHFRGFDSYFAIPYGAKDAREGKWMAGPGMDLFKEVKKQMGDPEIIVEDLGHLTPSLKKLLQDTGYAGMKVLEYAFYDREGEKAAYIPYNYEKHCVGYIGTHDNDTIQGWMDTLKKEDLEFARDFIHSYGNRETFHWDLIRTLLASPAETTILQAQDLKALGGWARMNQPGSLGKNWAWRLKPHALDAENANWVRKIVDTYARLPKPEKKETEAEAEENNK